MMNRIHPNQMRQGIFVFAEVAGIYYPVLALRRRRIEKPNQKVGEHRTRFALRFAQSQTPAELRWRLEQRFLETR